MHPDLRSYLQKIENQYGDGDGYVMSLMISLSDIHFLNDNLCVPNLTEFDVSAYVSRPLDEVIFAHLRCMYFARQPGVENLEKAVKWQVNALTLATKFVSSMQEENWAIPILVNLARDLRKLTFKLMATKKCRVGMEDDEEIVGKRDPFGIASDTIMSAFRICAADVRTAEGESKRWGMLGLVNQMLRIYSKGGHLEMYRPLMRAIDQISMKNKFPVAQMVTYKYLVGQKLVFDSEFAKAAEHLTYAFERCMKSHSENKRRILIYLIPAKMILGQMPKMFLLTKYNLQQFTDVVLAVKEGNVRRLSQALETHHDFFVESGIYLILERLLTITCRNLFKKIYLMFGSHQIDIDLFERALRYLGMDDVDRAETQCIIANLIDEGRIKGYISLAHNKLVVSKVSPFPLGSSS